MIEAYNVPIGRHFKMKQGYTTTLLHYPITALRVSLKPGCQSQGEAAVVHLQFPQTPNRLL